MSESWTFKDEWLLPILLKLKGVDANIVQKNRVEKKKYISQALIDTGVVTAQLIIQNEEQVFKVKYLPVSPDKAEKFALSLVPEKFCRKHNLVPLSSDDNGIKVVMLNPSDLNAQSDVEALTGRRLLPLFGLPQEVDNCIEQLFSSDTLVSKLVNKVGAAGEVSVVHESDEENTVTEEVSAPIIRLVDSIIINAYQKKASDIHIEHEEKNSLVRIRVDGELQTLITLPSSIAVGPVVSRIKIMSDLDVSNHMRPQDGRMKIIIGKVEVGLRVSTLPTAHGEKVVMRILDQRAAEVPFEKLGFAPEVAAGLDKCMGFTQGIILVTGPTGSGKTTTLYSVLNKCKEETTNVVTVEDPIEYKLKGINQVQVNEKQGLNFAAVLRSVLRQDPDIIMVGEIRDHETADMAFQAAMTGHLVLSTLHTNDTISTISRLVDMGIDRFKISPGLLAITAQRLVRKLCPDCVQQVPAAQADPVILKMLSDNGFEKVYYQAAGCEKCNKTGYVGRTSVVELLQADAQVKELINSGAQAEKIREAATDSKCFRSIAYDTLWHMSTKQVDLKEAKPYLDIPKSGKETSSPSPAPICTPQPVSSQQVQAAPATVSSVSATGACIMIADDDPIMRMLLKKFIEGAGHKVIEAVDGEEALGKIAEGPVPDLLVSDINMPRLNGLELVKGIRGSLGLLDMPIIMLTTESSDKSQELAFNLGANDYIIKPFKGPLVIARINAALLRSGGDNNAV